MPWYLLNALSASGPPLFSHTEINPLALPLRGDAVSITHRSCSGKSDTAFTYLPGCPSRPPSRSSKLLAARPPARPVSLCSRQRLIDRSVGLFSRYSSFNFLSVSPTYPSRTTQTSARRRRRGLALFVSVRCGCSVRLGWVVSLFRFGSARLCSVQLGWFRYVPPTSSPRGDARGRLSTKTTQYT